MANAECNAALRGPGIFEVTILARLAQSEQMRQFFIQMWLQNPVLARHLGHRVRSFLSPLACEAGKAGTASEGHPTWTSPA